MQTIESRETLFAAMKNGAAIITPNNRLSNQLLHDFFKQTKSDGQACDKAHCLPYQGFLRDLFKKARHLYPAIAHPMLLSSQQQRHLWRSILTQHQETCNDGLLAEIQNAWARCQHWLIDSDDPAFAQTPQTRQFQQWQQHLQHRLNVLGALTEEQLAPYVLTYPELFNSTRLCRQTIWACFDDYTPQQRALQQAMEAEGCPQYHYDLAPRSNAAHHYVAKDCQDEYLQMIQWLKNKLAAGTPRIAVVIPDLQTQSKYLQRLLQQHIPCDQFNISLGQPLSDYPLVAHALHWLGLEKQTMNNHQARLLLHSPYLAGAKMEFTGRAEAMQDCSVLQEATLSLTALINALSYTAPKLAAVLSSLSDYPQEAHPSVWISHFKTRLIKLGFPGEYSLSSSTYQCFQRFITLFDELLQLSVITPLMNKTQALNALSELAKSTIFQAQKSTTPIQVLGLLEASGCTFDSVWVSGLTDQCLPQKINLSAFIPLDVQRKHQMPHAIAERELQFAQQLLQRLQNGCQDSVFSHPRLTGDIPNLPCPLICHLPKLIVCELPATRSTSCLISQNEHYILPLRATESVRGGTALLANQAQCPFRAFATHRLYASPGPAISDGPDASERGQIIHKIMDLLWKHLGSQRNLLVLTPDEMHQLIENAITHALTPLINEGSHSFSPLVQEVERSRLYRLTHACLEWDKQRPPFVVEAVEQTFTLNLAGIDFRVRVDRLDRVTSDKQWVIDYKSSLPINKPWNEERPEAPQLLLYALLDDSINALLFVQLKAGRITCSGLSEDSSPVQGVSVLKKGEKWPERRQQWHQQLTQLANEFQTGHCLPQPNRGSTCQHCDFPNLCRIQSP